MIYASEAQPRAVYRRPRGAMAGSYYTLHPSKVQTYLRRLAARRAHLLGRDTSLLRDLGQHPDWVLFRWYLRGVDPFTAERYELRRPVLLPPDYRLRQVKARPGYR